MQWASNVGNVLAEEQLKGYKHNLGNCPEFVPWEAICVENFEDNSRIATLINYMVLDSVISPMLWPIGNSPEDVPKQSVKGKIMLGWLLKNGVVCECIRNH
ncbi:hypothetical protein RhiirA5_408453 [Rhizophagus irregularis]|uniref:Uncharacterized protein n=1 Tax=Rhizophagus irregularis TaxID=588596 RepID=A0A2N0Q831_9GLOM|nr:hypothetical protein RhiirA5_408453 [Rhizophagus irregularis]